MKRAAKVLIVSASMGAGHDVVAHELARRLTDANADATVVDLLDLAGSAGRRLRRTYATLLRYWPWLYDGAMRFWARWPRPLERLTAVGAKPFEAALATAVAIANPDVIVSVYNLASQCLGRMVQRRELRPPVATLVVDAGPHPYWLSAGVDAHLVPHEHTARALARYDPRGLIVTAPIVRPEFTHPPTRAEARRRLKLPAHDRIALINAGSWAVGGLRRTLTVAASINGLTCIVLCGRDERLRTRLAARGPVHAVGWTSQMADYLAAADVVIDNAGGQTCREAQTCHTPVVLFRPLPGHGRLNALALEHIGAARYARSAAELRAILRDAVPVAVIGSAGGADSVSVILNLAAEHAEPDSGTQSATPRS